MAEDGDGDGDGDGSVNSEFGANSDAFELGLGLYEQARERTCMMMYK